MAEYCFDVVLAKLEHKNIPSCPAIVSNGKSPLIVEWKNLTQEYVESCPPPPAGNRGCAATFDPIPLHKGLQQFALASAFEDQRFEPLTIDEVPLLQCSVNLPYGIEPISDYRDWIIGVHGLRVHLTDEGEEPTAFYLPEVPREKEWSEEMTVDELLCKAGFSGETISEADRKRARIERYAVHRVTLSYDEYYEMKKEPAERSR
ncbi:AMMECR1 domain containing protein [Aphelenchoides avenae]|nr:AMMECR1 domain containing protein [Aphelenchus avenae]